MNEKAKSNEYLLMKFDGGYLEWVNVRKERIRRLSAAQTCNEGADHQHMSGRLETALGFTANWTRYTIQERSLTRELFLECKLAAIVLRDYG